MRTHTQEKPHVCDFPGCGKAFPLASALTIHQREFPPSVEARDIFSSAAHPFPSRLRAHP